MGEREMILLLAAMFFFTMNSLSVNRFCLNNSDIIMRSEYDYYAISLAQRIIEEAKTRVFDSTVETGPATNPPSSFTYPPSRRSGEYYPNLTDVDDYHNLYLTETTPKVSYNIVVKAGYVTEINPDVFVTYKTFHKKIQVTVTSDYITAPVVLSHVYSYYEF